MQTEYARQGGVQIEYVQRQLRPLIEADLRQMFELDAEGKPRLRNITELPDDLAAALSSVKVDNEGKITEFKLASRTDAARALLASIGGMVEQHAHLVAFAPSGESIVDRLNAARARQRDRMIAAGFSSEAAMKRYPDVVAGANESDVVLGALGALSIDDQRILIGVLEQSLETEPGK